MTIQEEMHKRFNDILRQYDNEVNAEEKILEMETIFIIFSQI